MITKLRLPSLIVVLGMVLTANACKRSTSPDSAETPSDLPMHYLIWVLSDDEERLYVGPVPPKSAAFLQRATGSLQPLSDEDYLNGPDVFLATAARSSYVLHGEDVYWCVEWQPGLIVVRFTPGGRMEWVALRSPIPDFGGREADPAEVEAFDEDAWNPHYDLVFDAWDAQFDAQNREWGSFTPARPEVAAKYEAALEHVSQLTENRSTTDPEWFDRCKANLTRWAGEGVVLPLEED